jgi:putative transposase
VIGEDRLGLETIYIRHDVLATSEAVRVFTLVDVYTRECVALEVARSFGGADVARLLSDAGERAGAPPAVIQCDNVLPWLSSLS